MRRILALLISGLAFSAPAISGATVTLLEKDDWKVQMGGFIESDVFHDSTRSFTEVVGNGPVSRTGSFAGENGRTQMSIRNSRLAFTVLPPDQNEWKSKGYFEFDLLGYDPAPAAQSEGSFYTNPTLRARHAYFKTENDGWSILAGQTWTLFGWEPTYVLTTASVPPGPGTIYQRTPQITGMKDLHFGEQSSLLVGVSIARPSQRDSSMPNIDAGAKFSYAGLKSGFASPSGDIKAEPLSVAVSGTMRQFATPSSATATDFTTTKTNGTAFALDAMIPVLPSSDGKDVGNTLTLTGEFSAGKGYSDAFPSFTGNLQQLPAGTGQAGNANLDPGQGGYDNNTTFQLVKLQTWNAELQYVLPGGRCFVTAGHAELSGSNMGDFAVPAGTHVYDKSKMDFVNFFHDFTSQIRGAVEYAKFTTHYMDGIEAKDDRYGVTAYFRF